MREGFYQEISPDEEYEYWTIKAAGGIKEYRKNPQDVILHQVVEDILKAHFLLKQNLENVDPNIILMGNDEELKALEEQVGEIILKESAKNFVDNAPLCSLFDTYLQPRGSGCSNIVWKHLDNHLN